MAKLSGRSSRARFAAYVEKLTEVIGHADRAGPLRDYCTGLLMPAERKSVEPMAAVTAPARVAAQHQSLLHFVANAPWSDQAVLAKVCEIVLPEVTRTEPIAAWIIDDTGFPKKGRHSVGVARQYCGQLGKQDNCQVAVSLSLANHGASLPVSYRLYLPPGLGRGPGPARQGGRARGDRLPDQAGDRARSASGRGGGRSAARSRRDGCRLREGHGVPYGRERARSALRGGRPVEHDGVAARHRAAGAQAVVGPGAAGDAAAPGCAAPAGLGQGAGIGPARDRLDRDRLARRHERGACLALCPKPGARGARRHAARRAARGGMAPDRVARGRSGADPVLAVDPARGDRLRRSGRPGPAALADRAGLPGAQAGTRAWALRGPRLARLPPPR